MLRKKFKCPRCNRRYSKKATLLFHVRGCHSPATVLRVEAELKEDTDQTYPCKHCNKLLVGSARRHEKSCKLNPDVAARDTGDLKRFMDQVKWFALNRGRLVTINTWRAYGRLIRKLVKHDRPPSSFAYTWFGEDRYRKLPDCEDWLKTCTAGLSTRLNMTLAYIKLVDFCRYTLCQQKLQVSRLEYADAKEELEERRAAALQLGRAVKRQLALARTQRQFEQVTGRRTDVYIPMPFLDAVEIFPEYIRSPRRKLWLDWIEANGYVPNPHIGLVDVRMFLAFNLFYRGTGCRGDAVQCITRNEVGTPLRFQSTTGEAYVEIRAHTFKTRKSLGHHSFVLPESEYALVANYMEEVPNWEKSKYQRVFAGPDGSDLPLGPRLMKPLVQCVEAAKGKHVRPSDYRHFLDTLWNKTNDPRIKVTGARQSSHTVQTSELYVDHVERAKDVILVQEAVASATCYAQVPATPPTTPGTPGPTLFEGTAHCCNDCQLEVLCEACVHHCHDGCGDRHEISEECAKVCQCECGGVNCLPG